MPLGHPSAPLSLLMILLSSLLIGPLSHAQTAQPYLFVEIPPSPTQPIAGMLAFFRSDTTGALTLLPDSVSTFHDACVPSAIDPNGRFLYSFCGDGASMYAIDTTTLALSEVSNAPFAASQLQGFFTSAIIAESSGHFVYVIKQSESATELTRNFYLDTFQVDAVTPTLVPLSSQPLDLVGAGTIVVDPNGHGLALFVNQQNAGANPDAVLYLITFDPVTGVPTFDPGGGQIVGQNARALAISPTGIFLALSYGVSVGNLSSYAISSTSFTLSNPAVYELGPDQTPAGKYVIGGSIFFNPGSQILYVQSAPPDFSGGGLPFQLFDPPSLLLLPSSPLALTDAIAFADGLPDPQGPFVYSSPSSGGLSVFYVDPISGHASQTGTISAPFNPELGFLPPKIASLGPNGGQGTSGPVLSLSVPSLTFPQTTSGQSSAAQYVILKNVGTEVVSLTSISITGINSADFQLTGNCNPLALAANQSCTLAVIYSPTAAGTSVASIVVSSSAPQSPQSVSLAGSAIAPISHVSFSPASIVFPATSEGATSSPIVLTLTNAGGAALHITNTSIAGSNVPDFSFAPTTCIGAINAGASCTLTVTFTPLAAGLRSATWTVTDDAAGSPHVISITGTGAPAVQIGAASGGSTIANVSAGQPAQFNLQATPGNGFTGTLTFTCAGVPFGATCVPPASLPVFAGSPAPFTVSINTLGTSALPPPAPLSNSPFRPTPWLLVAALAALLVLLMTQLRSYAPSFPRPVTIAATALSLCLIFSGIGCGGAGANSNSQQPPPEQQTATPTIQPTGGTFSAPQSVSISDSTSGATIYFTIDGSAPSTSSSVYSAPFSLNSAATVKAMAAASSHTNSSVQSAGFSFRSPAGTYSITVSATATPTGSSKSLQLAPIVLTLVVN
ncbi:MAG TPA: choice-of-anchor D domain-containing protein [Dongiaceae bacterium]|nr:choice-of-anchor D domain-containing protein [Dongiaceae bacterium]